MKKYIIEGGTPLSGKVTISGSKNSALPIMAATLLCDEEVVLHNVPKLRDIYTMKNLLIKLGKKVDDMGGNTIKIAPERENCYQADYEIVKQMRASITVLGPLLAKHRQAIVSFPGGCVFGPRPIDIHLKGLRALGAKINVDHGFIKAGETKLRGAEVNLLGEFGTSVLATDNVLMAATLAEGVTLIENSAQEPEVIDLVNFLRQMGAQIDRTSISAFTVHGVKKLSGTEYTIIDDRIEAGTFLGFAAMTGGEIDVQYRNCDHLTSVFELCEQIQIPIEQNQTGFIVKPITSEAMKSFSVKTLPYPHFPTDLQPIFGTLATIIPGHTTIIEKIFLNRFSYAAELMRMGADIQIQNGLIAIKGVSELQGAVVQASDLRAGAALIAAGLNASGTTEVRRIYHSERGYEGLPEKVRSLGGRLEVVDDTIL